MIEDNEDKSNSPESARFGNFPNYYSFNSVENRTRLFPDYLKYVNLEQSNRILCLDVGCNTGELTHALQNHVTASIKRKDNEDIETLKCHMLAVDLDENLIERANDKNQNEFVSFLCVDVVSDHFKYIYDQYLKQYNRQSFDIVYCFSITMWIHINHGDDGLQKFIINVSKIARFLVIEPQPWKCYGRAVRRMKRTNSEPFKEFDNLKIRKDVEVYVDSLLINECNFVKIFETAPTRWGRQIHFYKKK